MDTRKKYLHKMPGHNNDPPSNYEDERADDNQLPAYSVTPDPNGIELHNFDFDAQGVRDQDGRVTISLDAKTTLPTDVASRLHNELVGEAPPTYGPFTATPDPGPAPRMNIVMHVVGSRGDVQPFLALARVLQQAHGHRVRLATHPKFAPMVEEAGVEFFSLGGDPAELREYMVKNAGLVPGVEGLLGGDVGRKRRFIAEVAKGCWKSCIEPCAATGRAFVADAIIANPPSFAHVHCAERLGVPLHLMFTMPWTPSLSFPHPLANIQPTTASPQLSNLLSFHLVEMLTWQGLGDVINDFRAQTLGLEPLSSLFAPGLTWRLKIPFTYAWSPALLPRPAEWGDHVNISGYFTDPAHTAHDPSPELAKFLESGDPPVYIGFGSIRFDNSAEVTALILSAIERCGVRAVISRGWAGLGSDLRPEDTPETVLFVDDTPHPLLFPRCSAVVHHGGAGTTAAGLAVGRPTVVVPFFGDQWFWGDTVARRGAGPRPVPFRKLTADRLSEAIGFALRPGCRDAAREIAESMEREDGCKAGAAFFHAALRSDSRGGVSRCAVCPERIACWKVARKSPSSGKKSSGSKSSSIDADEGDDGGEVVRLSALTAVVLVSEKKIDARDLELLRTFEHENSKANVPWDPVSSLLANTTSTISNVLLGVAAGPREAYRQVSASKARAKAQRQDTAGESSTTQSSLDARTVDPDSASTTSETRTEDPLYAQNIDPALRRKPLPATARVENSSAEKPAGGATSSSNASTYSTAPTTSPSPSSSLNAAGAIALESTKGVGRIMTAGLKTPATFTNGLARGFHNVPTLYGDDTVRPEAKIDGVRSGLVAAGKGFGYGLYDGLTGLVMQPYNGARKEGAVGFLKGFGKGLGGVVFKPSAAACGVPGYAFMGVYKSLAKLGDGEKATLEGYLAAARVAQGEEEAGALEKRDWEDIVGRWGVEVARRRAGGAS